MAAALSLIATSGVNCPRTGGVKSIRIIPTSGITEIVASATKHSITDLTFATAGAGFGVLNFKRGEAELTESMEQSNEVIINFAVPNPTAEQRFDLEKIRKNCESYLVVELYDKETLLFVGWDKLAEEEAFASFQSLESTSGRAKTDANLFAFNLRAEHSEILRTLSELSSVSATTKTAIFAELDSPTNV